MLHHTETSHCNNCVFPTLWQFGEDSHMGVMVRCPHTFGNIVYLKYTAVIYYFVCDFRPYE